MIGRNVLALLIGLLCTSGCGRGEVDPAKEVVPGLEDASTVLDDLNEAQAEALAEGRDVLLWFYEFDALPIRMGDRPSFRELMHECFKELAKDFVLVEINTGAPQFYRQLPPMLASVRTVVFGQVGADTTSRPLGFSSLMMSLQQTMFELVLTDPQGCPLAIQIARQSDDPDAFVEALRALRGIRVRRDAAMARAAPQPRAPRASGSCMRQ